MPIRAPGARPPPWRGRRGPGARVGGYSRSWAEEGVAAGTVPGPRAPVRTRAERARLGADFVEAVVISATYTYLCCVVLTRSSGTSPAPAAGSAGGRLRGRAPKPHPGDGCWLISGVDRLLSDKQPGCWRDANGDNRPPGITRRPVLSQATYTAPAAPGHGTADWIAVSLQLFYAPRSQRCF